MYGNIGTMRLDAPLPAAIDCARGCGRKPQHRLCLKRFARLPCAGPDELRVGRESFAYRLDSREAGELLFQLTAMGCFILEQRVFPTPLNRSGRRD
jgi:hypothetical protein